MNETYPRLDLRYVASVLRRRGLWIAAFVGVVFVVVYLLSSLQANVYTATAEVQITSAPREVLDQDGKSNTGGKEPTLGNEIYRVTSSTVREGVRAAIGEDAFDTIRGVGVTRIPETDVLKISVQGTDPEVARDAADAYATVYVDIRSDELQQSLLQQADEVRASAGQIQERITEIDQLLATTTGTEAEVLEAERAGLIADRSLLNREALSLEREASAAAAGLRVTKQADVPRLPDSPTPLRDAGIAALVALVVGIGAAFLVDQLDTRIKSPAAINEATGGLPLLGSIPALTRRRRLHRSAETPREIVPSGSAPAESFRAIATGLRFSGLGKEKRRILVTSATSGEGKTTLTANLASALAENGLRVLVVSADLRRPQLGVMLGASDLDKGLTSVILGDEDLVDVLVSVSRAGDEAITLLPSGPVPHDPSVLLGSDEFGEVLDQFEHAGADFIIVDCAPVLPVSDPLAVSRHVDGVILVSMYNKTRRNELRHAVDRLEKVDAEIIGVVLNGVVPSSEYGYLGSYGYAPAK